MIQLFEFYRLVTCFLEIFNEDGDNIITAWA